MLRQRILCVLFTGVMCAYAILESDTDSTNKPNSKSQVTKSSYEPHKRQKRFNCEPDITIAPDTKVQIFKTENRYASIYLRQDNLQYIDIVVDFTFGQERKVFPMDGCIINSSCWHELKVRAMRNPRGPRASKWAVELKLGSCSMNHTFSYLYYLNKVVSMSVIAKGSSDWFFSNRGLVCLQRKNPSYCIELFAYTVAEKNGMTSVEVAFIVISILLTAIIFIVIAMRCKQKKRSGE